MNLFLYLFTTIIGNGCGITLTTVININNPMLSGNPLHKFIEKLQEKNQSPEQQKEASQSVSMYYEMLQSKVEATRRGTIGLPASLQSGGNSTSNALLPPFNAKPISEVTLNDPLAEWKKAHSELFAEIKTRHYSPKTLKSYACGSGSSSSLQRTKCPGHYLRTM